MATKNLNRHEVRRLFRQVQIAIVLLVVTIALLVAGSIFDQNIIPVLAGLSSGFLLVYLGRIIWPILTD